MTHEMLVRYCFNDYDREMAIVAEQGRGKRKRLLGVGRFMLDAGNESAEFAIVVTGAFRRKGLGRELLEYVEEIAGARGLKRIWGIVSSENKAMIELAKNKGFEARLDPEKHAYRLEKKL